MPTPHMRVSSVFEDGRYPSRPYAVTIRIGRIVRTERFPTRQLAKVGRKEAKSSVTELANALKRKEGAK